MQKPIIGIVGRSFEVEGNSTIQLGEDYRLAVIKAGGIPIMILPTNTINYGKTRPRDAKRLTNLEKEDLIQVLKMCDAIIMPGGTQWYDFDEVICTYALDNDIPILGICLGLQILGNVDTFFQQQPVSKTQKNKTKIHMQPDQFYAHEVEIQDVILKNILNKKHIKVNSRHHFHILKKPYFKVEAIAEDGQIEAISIPNKKFALALQWHPENMVEKDPIMLEIFKQLIVSSKRSN